MFVGVDGCRGGWFSVALKVDGPPELEVHGSFEELCARNHDARSILVDVPIGLRAGGEERRCDREARRRVGARRSSVFPAPTRAALGATSYREASELNRSLSGRGLSLQSWAISAKIHEVDTLLRTRQELRGRVREVHLEVLFWALNGCTALSHPKKRSRGIEERLGILERYLPETRAIFDAEGLPMEMVYWRPDRGRTGPGQVASR